MGMVETVSRVAALELIRADLSLDEDADDDLIIAGSLRRTASLRCPLTRRSLEELVRSALLPILEADTDEVREILDALLASGDLIEARVESAGSRSQVFLGPPRYVRRRDGALVLVGVRPDTAELAPDELRGRLRRVRHLRILPFATEDDRVLLREHGFEEISEASWLRHEEPAEATAMVDMYRQALDRQGPSGEIDGLRLLDPASRTTYYQGRWRVPRPDDAGMFVGRRPQRFGSELWTLVKLDGGSAVRMLDLPLVPDHRGCDEAWWLQAAIDACRLSPQVAQVARTGHGRIRIGISMPPPRWLQRRWDLIGVPSAHRLGLLAYEFDPSDAREEIQYLNDHLWMTTQIAQEAKT